jgi:hypothetical protein
MMLQLPGRTQMFDARGRRIEDPAARPQVDTVSALRALIDAPDPPGTADAGTPSTETVMGCFELRSGSLVLGIDLLIELTLGDPINHPDTIRGVSLTGDICTAPGTGWQVTGGSIFGNAANEFMFIVGELLPLENSPVAAEALTAENCASSVIIFTRLKHLGAYTGRFGFNSLPSIPCAVLFKHWGACP